MKNNKNEYVNTSSQNNMCCDRCGSTTSYNNVNDQINFKNAIICLMNPLSIVDFDLKMFTENCYFISYLFVKQNYAILLDDNDEEKNISWILLKISMIVFFKERMK